MKPWAWLLLATIASAFLFQAALPPVGMSVLGWFCFVPTLVACRGKGFALGFGSGLFAVVGASFLARYGLWCKPVLLDQDPGWIYAGFALFGGPVGLLHGIVGEAKTTTRWTPLLFAAWAVLFEALLLLYLPAHLSLTQSRNTFLLVLSSVTGIWGASFVVWLANIKIAQVLAEKRTKATFAVVASTLVLSAGTLVPLGKSESRGYHVTAVQAPLDESAYFHQAAYSKESFIGIVVWPESAGINSVRHGDTKELIDWARFPGITPFATTFDDDVAPHPHNTLAVFSASGESARYYKRQLFGGEKYDHTPGSQAVVATENGVPLGLNVCFDSCYPSVMRETARKGKVAVILLPTLDPSVPYAVTEAVHAAYTPFRAAELGVFIVRAEPNAFSMIVDQNGTILAEAPAGAKTTITADIEPVYRDTLYKELGDWFLVLCALIATTPFALKLRERASKSPRPD